MLIYFFKLFYIHIFVVSKGINQNLITDYRPLKLKKMITSKTDSTTTHFFKIDVKTYTDFWNKLGSFVNSLSEKPEVIYVSKTIFNSVSKNKKVKVWGIKLESNYSFKTKEVKVIVDHK